ncbi:MAG: RNA methyltransferase [Myxococcota bacterium]|nr:RNA methyltransferase [Myxococcota bacterium]
MTVHTTHEVANLNPEVHIALVHYPVLNKEGQIVSTAVTNLDIHDNARSARAFDVTSYHIVTPLDAQVDLVTRILTHWCDGFGARRVPNRVEAMRLVQVSRTVEEAVHTIMAGRPGRPLVIATGARKRENPLAYERARSIILNNSAPVVILFGTGYGLANEIFEMADAVLAPIGNPDGWNHLSVRSAVAITLDRLLSGCIA